MKVYLYVLDTLSDWEIGYLTAELNSKRFFHEKIEENVLVKIADSKEPITSMGGIVIHPDETIDNIKFQKDDILVLPGADSWIDSKHAKILEIAKDRINNGSNVAAICGATLALANIGSLDEKKHTSNDKEFLKMFCPNYKGSDLYVNEPAVCDENLITASGMAPLEFTCKIFEKMNYFRKRSIEVWYNLHKTSSSQYFFELMDSLK